MAIHIRENMSKTKKFFVGVLVVLAYALSMFSTNPEKRDRIAEYYHAIFSKEYQQSKSRLYEQFGKGPSRPSAPAHQQ